MPQVRSVIVAAAVAFAAMARPTAAFAYAASYDPAGSGAIAAAVRWIQGTLLGTVATSIAIVAVASIGFLMLMGRLNWRYGASVVLGCFILFGAPTIAAGIRGAVAGDGREWAPPPVAVAPRRVPVAVVPTAPVSRPASADPFAGAAVPTR